MSDQARLRSFLDCHGATADDVAMLWDGSVDDVVAVLDGSAMMTARHCVLLSLFGSAHKESRNSCLRQLRAAAGARELWRPIPSFEKYEASSTGRIRRAYGGSGASPLRVLKQSPRPDGYMRVTLYAADGRMHTKQVHRMVCAAFHGEQPESHACHRDGDKLHNEPTNLYWGTAVDNARDTATHREEAIRRAVAPKVGKKTGTGICPHRVRRLMFSGKISRKKGLQLLQEARELHPW